ncbi:hypothetical protein T03_2917 [Trichinella britovi]|uniref:Uncharacterized protein n=1 Tax=Trichinella britovi TaxID=45882 RepID=A0A0V0ZCY5_TRIBR|nr:hypothetical protein T03_2917 [Trichinella britovi]
MSMQYVLRDIEKRAKEPQKDRESFLAASISGTN